MQTLEAICVAEGWGIFEVGGSGQEEIERDDEANVFPSDADALAFVQVRAAEGSEIHQTALGRHMRSVVELAKAS